MTRARATRLIRKALIIAAAAIVVFALSLLLPPSQRVGEPERITIVIPKGAKLHQIADLLKADGLIRNRSMFILAAKALGVERKVKAGRFTIEARLGTVDLIMRLVEGMAHPDLVMIPEGLTCREIAERLRRDIFLDPTAFLSMVNDSVIAVSLGVTVGSLEGYLFPDTYAFIPGMEPFEIIREMVARGKAAFGPKYTDRATQLGLSWHEVLTFASIVEGEATLASERPRIAAVFWNRLKRGWKLQADPTVAYALGGRKQRILYRDLEVPSPYNTYLVNNLPPGPIGNPGRAAVMAVLFPLEDCDDMYFVARGDGSHIFSATIDEHAAAIREARAARDAKNMAGPKDAVPGKAGE